ncbi:hypothetical protein [Pseudoxanthomonas sp.]|uniref:hypothetical protein n=1 Tax=Pseudoxanthomonas sp. TaxID=1871049 RepID=UPI0028C4E765|nr:hypothetical protein [Pseudoxanthomonas sp.]
MDSFIEGVFLRELDARCSACFLAVNELNSALSGKPSERDLFRPATELICQAAMISKLLWPPGNKNASSMARARARGEHLRKIIGVDDTHPVRSRTLRDHFEHYDERLDSWAESSRNHNIIKRFVGPRGAIAGDAISDGDIIEHYDPSTKILSFRGESFDIQALVDGIASIKSKVLELLGSRHGI